MTASERIRMIKEISISLSTEDWSLIDLTLKQFNFPIQEDFGSDQFHYIIEQIKDGDDNDIINLANHLKIEVTTSESELVSTFWREGYFKLFISHLSTEKVKANEVKDSLEKYAISGFVAHTDIEPTKEWQNEIEFALRTCDALLAIMTPGFHESKWTDQEIGIALGRDILIIPIRLGLDPYGFIGKFQAIAQSRNDLLSEEIFNALVKNKKTNKKIAYAIMNRFENSNSYDESQKNIGLVKKIEYWDEKLIDRLKKSPENNSQIRDAYWVPGSISSILISLEKKK